MIDEYGYNSKVRRAFNARAVDYRYLHSDLGFNLSSIHPEDDFNAASFTASLLTEYADLYGFDDEQAMARLAIAADYLQDAPIGQLEKRLSQLNAEGAVDKKIKHLREFVLSISGEAANNLKLRFPVEAKEDPQVKPEKPKSHKAEYSVAAEPDYADLEDVIKYVYEVGNISPSHANALLVALGYVRPESGMTDELNNDVLRIRADLRARIETYRRSKPDASDQIGMRIIEAFIARSLDNPNLQLSLKDTEAMRSVGEVIVKLHRLRDVRTIASRERSNKYDGMGTKIDIE